MNPRPPLGSYRAGFDRARNCGYPATSRIPARTAAIAALDRPEADEEANGGAEAHEGEKRMGPMSDSARECVSLESIESVMAPGSGGSSP
jgi:hypothetical protein